MKVIRCSKGVRRGEVVGGIEDCGGIRTFAELKELSPQWSPRSIQLDKLSSRQGVDGKVEKGIVELIRVYN